jgi:hypothetical protein
VAGLVCVVLWHAAAASAQDETLDGALRFLLTNRAVATADFQRDARAAEDAHTAISRLLLIELVTLPLVSSSPAFTYRFDPAIGAPGRLTQSFGPFFVERTATAGRGRASVGFNIRVSGFSTLGGFDLDDGQLITTANRFVGDSQAFDEEALVLHIDSRTLTGMASYGITDRMDLSVAVPFVWLHLDGERLNRYYTDRLVQASATAVASGFGDTAVRTKVRLAGRETGVAVVGELLLPTGREEDLLGSGGVSAGAMAVVSFEHGLLSAHTNGGFTIGTLADQLDWRSALAVSASPKVTLIGELVVRRLSGVGGLAPVRTPHPVLPNVETMRLAGLGESLVTTTAVGGFKWNVAGTWLVNGQLAFGLTRGGLRAPVTAVFGLEYALGQ